MSSFCGSDNDENDYELGYRDGAAAAFGLMGMAEAIAENYDLIEMSAEEFERMMRGDEDPGYCPSCGAPWEIVRPGKSQPICGCQ